MQNLETIKNDMDILKVRYSIRTLEFNVKKMGKYQSAKCFIYFSTALKTDLNSNPS